MIFSVRLAGLRMIHVNLTSRRCVPCERGTPPLTGEEAARLLPQVPGWSLAETGTAILRTFTCKDFKEAISFVQAVAELAESEGHHPDIAIHYRRVALTLTTHAIHGLSENDFILAAKISELRR